MLSKEHFPVLAATGWLMAPDSFYGVRWMEELREGAANVAVAIIVV